MYEYSLQISEIQKELLELLKIFDAFCRRYDIKYSLHGGTMLGAVRHKGFIPWDDDIDITMTREEYSKFHDALRNDAVLRIDEKVLPRIMSNHNAAWLDLLIYDYISTIPILAKMKIALILVLKAMENTQETISINRRYSGYNKYLLFLREIVYYVGKLFPKAAIKGARAWISEHAFAGNRTLKHRSNDRYKELDKIIPSDWTSEYIDIQFEDELFMISKDYHRILVSCYGEDYMTPKPPSDARSVMHEKLRDMMRG